ATTKTLGSGARMATTPSVRRLSRFSRTERTLHWVHASAFLVLLGSGLCLYLPSHTELIARRPLLKDIHVYTALAWLTALALLLLGHLYLSLIHPSTRHSLSAITRGWVREDWALRHHPKWAEQLRQGDLAR